MVACQSHIRGYDGAAKKLLKLQKHIEHLEFNRMFSVYFQERLVSTRSPSRMARGQSLSSSRRRWSTPATASSCTSCGPRRRDSRRPPYSSSTPSPGSGSCSRSNTCAGMSAVHYASQKDFKSIHG